MPSNFPKLRFKEFTDEWQEKKLGDLGIFVSDGNYGEKYPKASEMKTSGVPFIRANNIKESRLTWEDMKYISPELHSSLTSGHLKPGDILVTTRGDIGLTAVVTKEFGDSNINAQICLLRVNNTLSPSYLFQYLGTTLGKTQFRKLQSGSALKQLPKEKLGCVKISLPQKKEQQKIADFLGVVDMKIERLEEKKKAFEKYKIGIMQAIFSQKIRFKKPDGSNFPDWEEKKVADIFKITRGNVLAVNKIKKISDGIYKYPVYSSQTLNNGLWGYYDNFLFDNAITWTTDGANAGDVNFRPGKFYCTNVCGVLISDKAYANLCISEILNRNTKKYVSFVGNPKLMNNVMAIIKIIIPESIEEQEKIAGFLAALDNKINLINNQLEQTKLFKKSLLQRMFV